MIAILDLKKQYLALKLEIDAAVLEVFARGQFINGANVQALENEVALYAGSSFGIGLNSGTDALHLALRALDIGPGHEVITTPFSFIASTEAIGMVGATPVFVDIDARTLNIDPSRIEAAITARTKAIMPVHLYGAPAPMQAIMKIAARLGVAVIEDCAQAIGATIDGKMVGSFGTFGAFSFFPSKNLGAYGDAGMLITGSRRLAERVKALRAHGGRVKYHHEELGINSRLDEVQAAILRVKLRYLSGWLETRRSLAARYTEVFARMNDDIVVPIEEAGCRNVYHQYTIRIRDRDELQKQLADAGVQTMVYYPVPLHVQEVHRTLGYTFGSFPTCEAAAMQVLSLPLYPELPNADQDYIISRVVERYNRCLR